MMENTLDLPRLDSVALEYDGRFFPAAYSESYRRNHAPVASIDRKASRTDSRRDLVDSIWQQLPLAQADPAEKDKAIESYIESLSRLNQLRTEVDQCLDKICLANFEFRMTTAIFDEDQKQQSISKKLSDMRANSELTIRPPKNHIDASRATLPLELLIPELKNALRDSVTEFVDDFFEGLRCLVDKQVFGLIEWPGENVCRYHFFHEVLLHAQSAPVEKTEIVQFDVLWANETTTRTSGSNTICLARHEHHVINAYVTSADNTRVVLPPDIQQAVDSIPAWLRPIVAIVDGTLIREIIKEQEVTHEDWEKVETHTEVIPQDDPIYGCEPAVIIDEFVLTGWGPKEIEAELQRRQKLRNEADEERFRRNARRDRYLFFAASTIAQLVALWLLVRAFSAPWLWVLSAMVFCASPPLWLASLRAHLAAKRTVPGFLQPELRVVGWSVFSFGIYLFVISAHVGWGALLLSVLLLLSGVVLSRVSLTPSAESLAARNSNESNS